MKHRIWRVFWIVGQHPCTISSTPKGKINDNQRATKITVWMTFLLSGYPWGRSPQGFPIPLYTKVFFFVCKPLYTRFLCTFINKHLVSSLELALSSQYLTQPLSGPRFLCTFVNKHLASSLELALSSQYLTQPLSGPPCWPASPL